MTTCPIRSLLRRDQGLALPPARPRRGARRCTAARRGVRVRGGGLHHPACWTAARSSAAAPLPRTHWAALGVLQPLPPELAAPRAEAHRGGARRVALDDEPIEETFGALMAYLGERWHSLTAGVAASFAALAMLCGAAFCRRAASFA